MLLLAVVAVRPMSSVVWLVVGLAEISDVKLSGCNNKLGFRATEVIAITTVMAKEPPIAPITKPA